MGFQDYISESEAASIAGVSCATLSRFAEAGYLQVESDSDGIRLFSRKELGDVFGVSIERLTTKPAPTPQPTAQSTTPPVEDVTCTLRPEWAIVDRKPVEEPSETKKSPIIEETQSVHPEITASLVSAPLSDSTPLIQERSGELMRLNDEVTKLTNIVKLQEKLLELREAEIADIKEQRTWLKTRVEKLEEKSDRDQLLLLAETQVIRRMVAHQTKKSPLRAALEFFGVIEPEKNSSAPLIEVAHNATKKPGDGPVMQ